MNAILTKMGALFATGVIAVTGAAPALAANIAGAHVDASIKAALTADVPSASDLATIEAQEDTDQAQIDALVNAQANGWCGWDCIDKKLKALGDKMTTNRINALNEVKTYVENKKNITDDERAALLSEVNTNITDMTDLKAKIDADTKHADLAADVGSITIDYRIYMLVIPQVSLMASADHKEWVYTDLTNVAADLQTKIDNLNDEQKKAEAQAKLDDMKAKIADAKANADAAIAEIVNLAPDHGDVNVRKADKAAIADAQTKIMAAHTDYVDARADVKAINAILNGQSSSAGGHTIMKVSPSAGSSIPHPLPPVSGTGHVIMKVNPGTPTVSSHVNVSAAVK